MALTPVEIKHMTPGRGLFGYKAGATDRLLAEIAASFEDVWRERADLADRVEQLETDLVRYRELESLLRTTAELFHSHQVGANRRFCVVAAYEFLSHPLGEYGHRDLLSL